MEGHSSKGKQKDVLQLLKDLQTWRAAYGGALPPEDSHLKSADYGPAGLVQEGAEFEGFDREPLSETMKLLEEALARLAREEFPQWFVLKDPYLDEPGDPSLVDHWRRWASRSDACAAKVGLHDKAIATLARYLEDEDLHVVYPKLLSRTEERDIEESNAAMLAEYRRLMRGGRSHAASLEHVAKAHRVGEDTVQRIIDVRDSIGPAVCVEGDCDNPGTRGGYCLKHYQRRRRFKNRAS